MNNIENMNRILRVLESSLDYPTVDFERLEPDTFGITKARRDGYLAVLDKKGFITGIHIIRWVDGVVKIDFSDISITFEGLEYLESLEEKCCRERAFNLPN